ncbi:DUF5363 domain-containing protein [Vibrio makurazakiensis]
MFKWFKSWLEKYDRCCEQLGLTPENKRSCVPYRPDPSLNPESKTKSEM